VNFLVLTTTVLRADSLWDFYDQDLLNPVRGFETYCTLHSTTPLDNCDSKMAAEVVDNEKALAPPTDIMDMGKGDSTSIDQDAMKLAEMGYTQDMQRNFSVWSVLGIGFSLTNSWFGVSSALITGIKSGGPVLIIYGIIMVALVSTCVGITLSELASALPNAGGQYFWANELAPKKWANFASYLTGWLAWAGSIFTSASVSLAVGSAMVGCYQLSHPDL
jgi:choline transport protein